MNDVALNLVERVLPEVPIRQWVCSLPWQLRYLLGYDRVLCAAVLQAFVLELMSSYKRRAKRMLGLRSLAHAHTGAVTFVQRFDSALRLNVHAHTLALDGVYVLGQDSSALRFHALGDPSADDMHELARRTAMRIEKLLRKHGRWLEDEHDATGDAPDVLAEEQTVLSACYRAAAQGTELLGQRSGQPTLRLLSTPPERSSQHDKRLLGEVRGVNIHATAAIDGRDRKRLERLCRYVARPPIAQERLQLLPDGRLRFQMKKAWADGTAALVFEPLSLIARLCALVPPPRFHMVRFAGVLAANAALRKEIVPACTPSPAPAQLVLFEQDAAALPTFAAPSTDVARSRSSRHPWAFLLRHTFAVDVLGCASCQGRMRLIEVATTATAVARVLARAGMRPQPPPRPRQVHQAQLALGL